MVEITGKSAAGFTLIELIIAVAIVGILSVIAVPSYTKHLARSNRAAAERELTQLAAAEESYFLRAHQYTATLSTLKGSSFSTNDYQIDAKGRVTTDANKAVYKIELTSVASTTNYTVVATALGKQAERDLQCASFYIDYKGTKGSYNSTGSASTGQCWAD